MAAWLALDVSKWLRVYICVWTGPFVDRGVVCFSLVRAWMPACCVHNIHTLNAGGMGGAVHRCIDQCMKEAVALIW